MQNEKTITLNFILFKLRIFRNIKMENCKNKTKWLMNGFAIRPFWYNKNKTSLQFLFCKTKLIFILALTLSACAGGMEPTLKQNNISNREYCECLINNHPVMSAYTVKVKAVFQRKCEKDPTAASNQAISMAYSQFAFDENNAMVAKMCAGVLK